MQLHDVNGVAVEIAEDEIKRVWPDMAKRMHGSHHFTVGGRTVMLTVPEMKEISRYYWEHFGKKSMLDFFEKYKHKAAENIRKALRMAEAPEEEADVKWAIAMALRHDDAALAGEVLFESMEFAVAHATLESIEE